MKTTKKEQRAQELTAHYERLGKLFEQQGGKTATGKTLTGKKLSLELFKLEQQAHKAAEDYCNGVIQLEVWDRITTSIETQVFILMPSLKGFFINGDPRGYALKIKTETMLKENYPLTRDWGGYGILSPEIN
jgi:hypothetical protein